MNLDLVLVDNPCFLNKKVEDVLALIALELDYLAHLFVLNHIAVAAEVFLEILEYLVVAEVLLQPLNCCKALLSIPLLHSDMHILLRPGGIRLSSFRKWIKSTWDHNVYLNHICSC